MDALSDVLRTVRFSGAVFIDADLSSPWAVVTPGAKDIAKALSATSSRVIPYHLVLQGECRIRVEGFKELVLVGGDIALFPHGDVHTLFCGSSESPTMLSSEFVDEVLKRKSILPIRYGQGGQSTRLVCGFFALDRWLGDHLMRGLPRMLSVHVGNQGGSDLLAAVARHSIQVSKGTGPASDALVCRLSEVLFLDAMRHVIASGELHCQGWLAGLGDPHIQDALSLLHTQPGRDWDIQTLASECGMSRSNLLERFNALVGQPPIQYLRQWRMTLAARDLVSEKASLKDLAGRYGYGSEASFSKAFQRTFGTPPASYARSVQ